jgi:DNA-binding response OmpR family regulator
VMSANKKLCLECGMDGFLGKPISTTELVEKIKNHRDSSSE